MGFAGNLSTLSLVEVFQTVNRNGATGVLRLVSIDLGRDVVFSDGEIIGVHFREGEEQLSLIRRMIIHGQIDPEWVPELSNIYQDSGPILERLVANGYVAQEAVIEAATQQAIDELYNICTWNFADFTFHDATPDQPDIVAEVEEFRNRPLEINLNSILMESARRADEWEQLRAIITSEDLVLGPADGQEQALLEASQSYPGAAVVPLIDAVRTVETIVKESIATRYDIYVVLSDLHQRNLVAVLSRDDIVSHGDYQFQQRDYQRAAELYRRALSEDPTDRTTNGKLADCLELLGDTPTAAGCFAQLALGYLDERQGEAAVAAAYRAVRLAQDDPRQHMILVRCLLDSGDNQRAIEELLWVANHYLQFGQLEDARGTCLKVLELDPTNENARRTMSRIFADAEKDKDSEDVVVCVQCGHMNHREAQNCIECDASLRLTCNSCSRTIAVSDRICIFCGASTQSDSKINLPASSTTAKSVRKIGMEPIITPGGIVGLRMETQIDKARQLEENGDFPAALENWRELSQQNPGNKELLTHIREIEAIIADEQAEKLIDRGHQLRRSRRYFAAVKFYRSALRAIPESDPRYARLKEILSSTQRDQKRIVFIYAAAGIAVVLFGWLLVRPYLQLSSFQNDLSITQALLTSNPPGTNPESFDTLKDITDKISKLDVRAQQLGDSSTAMEARTALNEFRGEVMMARTKLANSAEKDIKAALASKDIARADALLEQLRPPEFRSVLGPRFATLETEISEAKQRLADIATKRQNAPERFKEVQALEKEGALALALAGYRDLASIGHDSISPKAKECVSRLEPEEAAFNARMTELIKLAESNPSQVTEKIATIVKDAKIWGKESELITLQNQVQEKLQAAELAYQHLGASASPTALEEFIKNFPNTPQAASAQARLTRLQQMTAVRDRQIESYRTAMKDQQIETAWNLARSLFAGGVQLPEDIGLPVRIESSPTDAVVQINGQPLGKTPCVINFKPDQKTKHITISSEGWLPVDVAVAELVANWQAQFVMSRKPQWSLELGKSVGHLSATKEGKLFTLAGDVLLYLGIDGKEIWRVNFPVVDDLGGTQKTRLAHNPLVTPEGKCVLGLPGHDVVMLDSSGSIERRIVTKEKVRGRPQVYTNDLLGGQQRIAYAAESLFLLGSMGQEPTVIPLTSPALSGPLVFAHGPDKLVIVATIQGQLLAFEDSSRKAVWQGEHKATELGQLVPLGVDSFVTVMDGSRLGCFQVSDSGVRQRWNVPLNGSAVGDPVVIDNHIWVAAGTNIVHVTAEGAATVIKGNESIVTPVAVRGDLAVVGLKSQQFTVYRAGQVLWTSKCSSLPTAVALTDEAVVVGMMDGTLASYVP